MKRFMVLLLAVFIFLGFLLTANGCHGAWRLYKAEKEYSYEEKGGEVWLKTISGTVRMEFGENSVKIYDAHRYKSAVYEIAVFICEYGKENGCMMQRNKRELAGEIKLHNLLYLVGYKRVHAKHVDLEYTSDCRWYVNLASVVLG